jgi:phage baseplate assembly protein W
MSDFLGRGWRFPIVPDAGGALRYVEGDDNVGQSLQLLLSTGWGERVMRPRFGTNAREMVFAPGSVTNLRALEESVREAVAVHEPRADLESVTATPDPEEAERVDIEVVYTVRRSNTRASFVFPYYLTRPGGMP